MFESGLSERTRSNRSTRRRLSAASAAMIERPRSSSSSTGTSAMRRAGMSAATSTFLRRTMPMSITDLRAAAKKPGSAGVRPVSSSRAMSSAQRLLVVDPAEELPDRAEVLDRVDERRAGERHHQRPGVRGADVAAQREHVLAALRLEVLDEVRLVDDHALEAEPAEPADVPVEDLVVDDHDVAERIDVVAVAVHDGRGAAGGPQLDLAGPVRLHDVRHHGQQRVRVRGFGRQQRLRGLAEAGLVGEQERPVAGAHLLDESGLVAHEVERSGRVERLRLGKVHRRRAAPRADLERAEQRLDELPVGEEEVGLRLRGDGAEVRREEGVRHLELPHRCGNDLLLDLLVHGLRLVGDHELVRGSARRPRR